MRWPGRSPWWPPLVAAAAWFALACPLANRALRGLDVASSTRLMVLAIASLPVIGALRALIDARLAQAATAQKQPAQATEDSPPVLSTQAAGDEAPLEDEQLRRAAGADGARGR